MKCIFSQVDLNMKQRQWIKYSQKFNFKITYKPRRGNLAADTLSRKIQVPAITTVSNPIIELIQNVCPQDPPTSLKIISNYPNQATQETFKNYSIKD